jgi:hypothetical protein
MQLVSHNLRKLAALFLFAAAISKEQLETVVKKLEDILHDNGNFAPTEDQPLMFSTKGLEKVKTVDGENFSQARDMMGVLRILNRSMELAAKTGNEQIAYVMKTMEKAPGKWLRMNLKGLGFSDAKVKVTKDGFEYLIELLEKPLPKKTVTPEELQEMKERGVI